MKIKAAILVKQRKPLVIADIDASERLERGQVLVRVLVSGICGSQIGEIDGIKGPDVHLPHLLGHEGCGEVIKTGPGVTGVRKGDRVVLHWRRGAGIESKTPQYRWGNKTVNAGWVTTFNEMAIVSENRITRISRSIRPETAALLGCALSTAYGVLRNDAKFKKGESIAVIGTGGVGLAVVSMAKAFGASRIAAVDMHANKLRLAKSLGAGVCYTSVSNKARGSMMQLTRGFGFDVVVDCTGVVPLMEAAYELTAKTGRTILVGVPPKNHRIRIDSMPLHFGKVITGSWGGGVHPTRDIPRILRLIKSGNLNPARLVSDYFRLNDINKAISDLRTGKVIRAMIKFR